MSTTTVTNKGQITIPKEVREALGLDLMSLYGIVKPAVRGITLEDMEKAIRRGATEG
jgi:bifunctional DNA-binding transcriptional regulator/antitoxin component of YhaV-PrlF toxin-antitoxin module